MADLRGEKKLSRSFLLGMLRAALRPARVDVGEVRKLLRVVVMEGYNPVEMYREAVASRPENFDPPPLLADLLPKDVRREKVLDTAVGEVLEKKAGTKEQ
jgi:hypothetical protein